MVKQSSNMTVYKRKVITIIKSHNTISSLEPISSCGKYFP